MTNADNIIGIILSLSVAVAGIIITIIGIVGIIRKRGKKIRVKCLLVLMGILVFVFGLIAFFSAFPKSKEKYLRNYLIKSPFQIEIDGFFLLI